MIVAMLMVAVLFSGILYCAIMLVRSEWVRKTRVKWIYTEGERFESAASYGDMMKIRTLLNWKSDIGAWIK